MPRDGDMRLFMDRAVPFPGGRVATLSRVMRGVWKTEQDGIGGVAEKHPVAVLVLVGERFQALTPSGDPMDRDEVEKLCPGAEARLRASAEA
ncbi:hypothetical protein [Chachezhania sediminis]|uniref:hypothetical protein n=1 Tax=Chachezhania sediminis TaxID=2599291 RepID=UPI00131BB1AC|nr:hypothetical protein [Chachezhania sediminis]